MAFVGVTRIVFCSRPKERLLMCFYFLRKIDVIQFVYSCMSVFCVLLMAYCQKNVIWF